MPDRFGAIEIKLTELAGRINLLTWTIGVLVLISISILGKLLFLPPMVPHG
jgi:hypothetical protein